MRFYPQTQQRSITIIQLSLALLLIVLLVIFLSVMISKTCETHVLRYLGLADDKKFESLKFLGLAQGGILLVLQVLMSHRRSKAMEDAAHAQAKATGEQAIANQHTEQGQRQDRMKNAIEHLGHGSESVRLGGAYELFHLAHDIEEFRKTTLDILCSHIRQTTGESEYRHNHKLKPSEEVQSLLNLLFVQEHEVYSGLRANLQGSWLNGADLAEARLPKAVLAKANLQGVCLRNAQLEGSDLTEAQLQEADLTGAFLKEVDLAKSHMQKAILWNAQLQRSNLNAARLHGAILIDAQLQETGLNGTYLQAADLTMARMQMASLGGAQLQGACLAMAQLHGAILRDAQMQGTYLRAAQLHEAKFSSLQGFKKHNETYTQEIDPEPAQLQGVDSSKDIASFFIIDQIRDRINKESDLSGVKFAGGLIQDGVDSIVEGLSDERATELREKLEFHVGKPESNELPENSYATTGAYTEEEAEMWIAEYEEAVSGFLGDDS